MELELGNVEQAKAYFFKWKCNKYEMNREGDVWHTSYKRLVTSELENQWTNEYFEQLFARLEQSSADMKWCYYDEIAELFSSKLKISADVDKIVAATRHLQYSIPSVSKNRIARAILGKILPHLPKLGHLKNARELLQIVECLISDPEAAEEEQLLADYRQCANSVLEITTVDQAKEYYIRMGCSHNRMKYDYQEMVDSYNSIANARLECDWIQEAFGRNITCIQNREYGATEYSFYHGTINYFVNGVVDRNNASQLLTVTRTIQDYDNQYSYVYYASEIIKTVIPALLEQHMMEEAEDFLVIAKNLLHATPEFSRDWSFREIEKEVTSLEDRLATDPTRPNDD
ncbi:hypothetical protein K0T92_13605 [Paenibacillus oenotherae]|uniref:Uncharacterized protein n=1 Tax=Paenibacillus oenotherae TaxID=1435645 RepID=A0ABS7D7D5_9BACL|nr:hypothetical protein [Paenibacillus oenotherae]MBW7475785.1 hypothetical protein [Paenibacillus oenotherae]